MTDRQTDRLTNDTKFWGTLAQQMWPARQNPCLFPLQVSLRLKCWQDVSYKGMTCHERTYCTNRFMSTWVPVEYFQAVERRPFLAPMWQYSEPGHDIFHFRWNHVAYQQAWPWLHFAPWNFFEILELGSLEASQRKSTHRKVWQCLLHAWTFSGGHFASTPVQKSARQAFCLRGRILSTMLYPAETWWKSWTRCNITIALWLSNRIFL